MELYPYQSVLSCPTRIPNFARLNDWLTNFICQPHESLAKAGRETAVCPLALPALQQNKLWLSCIELHQETSLEKRDFLSLQLLNFAKMFKATTQVELSKNKIPLDCLVVPVLGLEKHEWRYVLDGAYSDVKTSILAMQLMIGSFHPLNNRTSRLSKTFFPLQSPLPMIAFRYMIRSDWRTLQERPEYMTQYATFFGDSKL